MSSSGKVEDSSSGGKLIPSPFELTKNIRSSARFFNYFSNIFRNLFQAKKTAPLVLDTTDAVALIFFMAAGMMSRVFRIQFPQTVVFDEVHFGNFTNWYIKGQYFHDIHPPLAKLIMAGVAKMAGYNGEYNFARIGSKDKYPSMVYVALRLTPAFFGALCVPLSYLALRAMNARHFAATIGAFMVMFDLVLIIEARHILSDGILHFFSCLAIFSIFLFERYQNVPSFVFEGFCLGCCAACKYTSGGIVLLAFIRQFDLTNILNIFTNTKQNIASVIKCFFLTVIISIVHIACFWIHLTVLPYPPENPTHMPLCIRQSLVDQNNPNWEIRQNAPSMLKRIITLILYMHRGNMNVGHSHPYASPWYSWPLATGKWLLFWTKDGKHLICMGNVLLWWPVFFSVIANIIRIFLTFDFQSELSAAAIGYFCSFLPFALIPRDMFLYHYAIPLLFGIYNLNLFIERTLPGKARGFCFMLFVTMAFIGYVKWNPWVYGLTTPDFRFLVWNKNWP
ncbi:Dolichyl-phosphate-mannose-protein mannosyltransferase [Tritrichomonas foetus]|uniref:Dolichyl-phosphate-mannose-protein mannosyltransferase n=1 Tax=Tritrichomonas foetus TaxID=1144522 RepID=A0A1J4KIN4_9EUKA|nr:Dolichyl-phosphate-mannose-protein mannosyltransferase [Tritrichomonas foetus]|eukprot:OHT10938.1 Dolichyl-phosphate-mannose-protein mannosyltransferase [Tritrichomonas foetus]